MIGAVDTGTKIFAAVGGLVLVFVFGQVLVQVHHGAHPESADRALSVKRAGCHGESLSGYIRRKRRWSQAAVRPRPTLL